MREIIEGEKIIHLPIEDVLGIEPGTTPIPYTEVNSPLVAYEEYDEKDTEIEEQFQELYDTALGAFETISENIDGIEPKFRARNHEVAVQYLNAALSAVKEKAGLKQHKDKTTTAKNTTINNNTLIVEDRNNLLKSLIEASAKNINE